MHLIERQRRPAGSIGHATARVRRALAPLGRALMATAMLLASGGVLQPQLAHADACTPPVANPVACENLQPGTPVATWDVSAGSPDQTIQGFTDDISYTAGRTVNFKINTPAGSYKIDIYRLGYYQGNGARLVASTTPTAALPQIQPACTTDVATGLIDCGDWSVSATWTVPANAVSGVYLAKLTRTDAGYVGPGSNHIAFVVRDDTSHSDVVFQTSDTTWEAYNTYGGNSLYAGSPVGRAYKVSYNRPFMTNTSKPETWLFADETPMIRFLEGNGYNVSYLSGVDTDRFGSTLLQNHKVFLSVGHDEYWSAQQRANVERARDQNHVNLAFFSGNESFWKTRWENSIDGANTNYRTLVSYKATQGGIDPLEPAIGTGTWRDPRYGADGGRPENSLSGNLFMVNGTDYRDLQVPAAYASTRLWRNTAVATNGAQGNPTTITAGCDCVLGYEWDAEYDNGSRPAGLIDLSSSTYTVNTLLQDFGVTYATGAATHHLTMYRAPSGALVFGAGTVNWAAGLDSIHSGLPSIPDRSMQQATINLLADMGAQVSGTLVNPQLSPATQTADTTKPTSTITSIAAGAHVAGGSQVVVKGSAADTGGVVAGVEVSVDGGTTWHPASGTSAWTYAWNVNAIAGALTIKTRAADDSANLETPGAGVTVTIDPAVCPCSIFHTSDAPAAQTAVDAQSVEIGVRFNPDQSGYVNGVRFYKQGSNTGTHVGTLWSNTGQKLAQATFANETASGWQQVLFGAPVAVTAGTTYVASYHAPSGGYSSTLNMFALAGIDNSPLHAPRDGLGGFGNGVFQYSATTPSVPTWGTSNSTNYWVDILFNTSRVDSVLPTVVSNASTSSAAGLPLDTQPSATFSEDMLQSTLSLTLKDPSGALVDGQISYNANTFTETFTPSGPLALGTTYVATVAGVQDLAGNTLATPTTWNLSTPTCPCSFWTDLTLPAVPSQADSQAVEVGMHFRTHIDGYITGIRFYQGPTNTGTHIGNLWSGTDHSLLASVSLAPSAQTGWQTASFSTPVYVQPATDYVISYHTDTGNYATSAGYFGTVDTDVGPLLAPASIRIGNVTSTNGVYSYGATGFPANPTGTNYWVDAIFNPTNGGAGVHILTHTVTKVDQNTASFAWTTDRLSDSVLVYGLTASYGSTTPLSTQQVTAHSALVTGLTPNTTYHYQLKSRDSAGNLAVSGDLTFTTAPIPDIVPPVITNIQKSGETSSTKQLITWTTNEPSDSELSYGPTSTYGTPIVLDSTSPVTLHKVELTNLSPSTLYHYQIGSKDPSNNLATTADDTFTTGNVQIAGVNAQVANDVSGDTNVTISWTSDAAADTVLDYGLSATYGTNVSVPDPVTSHTVSLTTLTPGTSYHYRVSSTVNGHSATSADFTFTTSDHQPPKISAVTTTIVDFTSETVAWTTDEPSTTEVDYSTDSSHSKIATNTALVTSHTLTLTGLTAGTMYHYIVKSTDASGNPAVTADNTFTTKAQTPPQINVGPSATATSSSATITWGTTVASDTQVKYGATTSYGSTSTLVTTPLTSHTVTLAGLNPSSTYHYQVLSRDPITTLLATSGDLTFSTTAAPDTTPPTLSVILGVPTTTTAIITWTTSELADSQVDFGTTTSYGTTTTLDQTLVTSHIVSLSGLTPNTAYHFRVKSNDAAKNLATSSDQTFTTLALPRSLSLNGSTAYAEAPNAAELNVVGDWTIETWFKETESFGYFHLPTAIISKGDITSDREMPFNIGIAFDQLFLTEKSNNSFSYMYYDLARHHVSANSWHHLAVSVKGSTRQATMYLDGVQVVQGTLSTVTSVGNSKPVSIGRNGGPSGSGNFQGKLDDVRIWNTVRTPAQISANYHAELSGTQPGLVGNWKFNEGSGTIAIDTAGTPQNATLNGGAGYSTDVHP